jgi:hypothetical protein
MMMMRACITTTNTPRHRLGDGMMVVAGVDRRHCSFIKTKNQ